MNGDKGQISRFVSSSVSSSKGFTLVELLIVMGLFMGVIIISSQAFNKILSVSIQQTKSSESDTQGVIGLEMLRADLEHAGYGLPWLLNFQAEFDEAQESLAPGVDSKNLNDKFNATSDTNKVPRAVQAAASTVDGRDYLVIKSIMAGMNSTVKKWAYVQGTAATGFSLKAWGSNDFDFIDKERVVTIDSRTKRLIGTSMTATNFSYPITTDLPMIPPAAFQPPQDTDFYVVYGVSDDVTPRVPYNRVDYYVKRPTLAKDMPTRCSPGTGILYKAVMNHSDGKFMEYPLVECIADMQIVFNVAADGVNGVDVNQGGLTGLSAKEIRQQLKMIKIYIVAHEGGKDTGFNYASQTMTVGEGSGRTLDLKDGVVGSDDYKHYRWKTYKLVVIPKNINY
jgi:hypothetical protein